MFDHAWCHNAALDISARACVQWAPRVVGIYAARCCDFDAFSGDALNAMLLWLLFCC